MARYLLAASPMPGQLRALTAALAAEPARHLAKVSPFEVISDVRGELHASASLTEVSAARNGAAL